MHRIRETEDVIRLAEEDKNRNDVELYSFEQVEEAYGKLVRGELRGRPVIQMGV